MHYERHLGPIYSWIVGDLEAALAQSRVELDELDVPPSPGGTAVDLGAGFGLHSVPLAERGYAVTAIDSYEPLLGEIRESPSLPIRAIVGDLLAFRTHIRHPVDVIIATFRDYISNTLQGNERFIPVQSDESRILTCFLEYAADRVTVHDLLHEKQQGRWQQRVSSYVKLRLSPQLVMERLKTLGFVVRLDTGTGGMSRVRGVRL